MDFKITTKRLIAPPGGLNATKRIVNTYVNMLLDPKVIFIFMFFAILYLLFTFVGRAVVPVAASLVLFYLFDDFVTFLSYKRIPRWCGATICLVLLTSALCLILFVFVPFFFYQGLKAANELPKYLSQSSLWIDQNFTAKITAELPYINFEKIQLFIASNILSVVNKIETDGVKIVSGKLSSIFSILVELVIMLFLVFFFLKDKKLIKLWAMKRLPSQSELLLQILRGVDIQVGKYIKGKLIVIAIIWAVCSVVFYLLNLKFWFVLSFLAGVANVIPYIGPIAIFFPVVAVGFFQYGISLNLFLLSIYYIIIQNVEGNVLTPIIVGRHTSLHPIAIIVSLLFFGTVWGFWGAFFSVPLLILIRGLLVNINKYINYKVIIGEVLQDSKPH